MKKLIILISLFIISCGTRKVEKSTLEVKKEINKETLIVDNKVSDIKTETNNNIITDNFEITPIDTTKEVVIIAPDGKVTKFKNAKISHKTIVDKTKAIIVEKVAETSQTKATEKSNEVIKATEKKIERTSRNWWWLLLLLIPLGYFAWQKFKDKIWWVKIVNIQHKKIK